MSDMFQDTTDKDKQQLREVREMDAETRRRAEERLRMRIELTDLLMRQGWPSVAEDNLCVDELMDYMAVAVAEAVKKRQEIIAHWMRRVVEQDEETARLRARVAELEDAARETVRRVLGGVLGGIVNG